MKLCGKCNTAEANPPPGGRAIERIPDRIEAKRHETYMAVLLPIYDRAGKACRVKGQKHLREFEHDTPQ